MPKNKIEDLRNMLFETMERLMDADDPMDLDRAETVGKVAQVIVNSAKVEVDFIKQTGHGGSTFIQGGTAPRQISAPLAAVAPIAIAADESAEQLCQRCPLPECNDTSSACLITIQRRQLKERAA